MNLIDGLQNAINYMEDNITEDIDYDKIAEVACSSRFYFQRIFQIVCGYTLGEYIRSRRLSLAAEELYNKNVKVIDVAFKYGYNSCESFSRAFTKFHGISPSQVKSGNSNLKSFSKLSIKIVIEGGKDMNYRIEKTGEFTIIAKRARYGGGKEISNKNIKKTWQTYFEDGTIKKLCSYIKPDNMFKGAIVGVCFDDPTKGDFDYAIGTLYDGGKVNEELSLENVPKNTWAVFPCVGKMPKAFEELYKRIYTEFFPTSKYQPYGGMCIEVYYSDDILSEDYKCEIWISVKEK